MLNENAAANRITDDDVDSNQDYDAQNVGLFEEKRLLLDS
jgi:hypothetical protein